MIRGIPPRPRWSSHPLCTRPRFRPKPSPRANVGRSSRPPEGERSFLPPFVKTPGAVRRPHAKKSRRAAADAPRRSEERGGCQQHAEVDDPSSQAPTRFVDGSELPAVRPKPIHVPSAHHRLVSPDERLASPGHRDAPGRFPARAEARAFDLPGAGCPATSSSSSRSSRLLRSWSGLPRDFFQLEPKLAPSEVLERVARVPTVPREEWSWAGLSKDPVPRRGFPHPLRSAYAVSHDLDGLLLSAPSDVFQSVTLLEFYYQESSTRRRSLLEQGPKTSAPRESPRGLPLLTRSRTTEAILGPTRSWQARKRDLECPCRGLIPPTGPAP
jgi:hypothetical protein